MDIHEEIQNAISRAFRNDTPPSDILAALSSNLQTVVQILPISKRDKVQALKSCLHAMVAAVEKNPNPLAKKMN